MEELMKGLLMEVELGEMQQHKNMAVFPITLSGNGSPKYLTLKEALDEVSIEVREKSQEGSVGELRLVNRGEYPVLLLDGEELIGAKQNRVLIASILVARHSEIVIPVNCTEVGRWSYTSDSFSESGHHMYADLRKEVCFLTGSSLARGGGYRSDQMRVWGGIGDMASCLGRSSPTSAMSDYYGQSREGLEEYSAAFQPVPHQRGIMVLVSGKVAGMEMLSLESAYENLHPKLIESYAMEAFLQGERQGHKPSLKMAKGFLKEIVSCGERAYKSKGLGYDHRFQGERTVGSALVYEDKVIHAAFFRRDNSGEKDGKMSAFRRRRDFRPYDIIN